MLHLHGSRTGRRQEDAGDAKIARRSATRTPRTQRGHEGLAGKPRGDINDTIFSLRGAISLSVIYIGFRSNIYEKMGKKSVKCSKSESQIVYKAEVKLCPNVRENTQRKFQKFFSCIHKILSKVQFQRI